MTTNEELRGPLNHKTRRQISQLWLYDRGLLDSTALDYREGLFGGLGSRAAIQYWTRKHRGRAEYEQKPSASNKAHLYAPCPLRDATEIFQILSEWLSCELYHGKLSLSAGVAE